MKPSFRKKLLPMFLVALPALLVSTWAIATSVMGSNVVSRTATGAPVRVGLNAGGVVVGNEATGVASSSGFQSGQILVGQADGGTPQPKTVSGLLTLDSTGVFAFSGDNDGGTPCTVGQGCTGAATLTSHGVLVGESTSAITASTAGTDGQLLIGQSSADPSFNTVTGVIALSKAGTSTFASDTITVGKYNYCGACTAGTSTNLRATCTGLTPTTGTKVSCFSAANQLWPTTPRVVVNSASTGTLVGRKSGIARATTGAAHIDNFYFDGTNWEDDDE